MLVPPNVGGTAARKRFHERLLEYSVETVSSRNRPPGSPSGGPHDLNQFAVWSQVLVRALTLRREFTVLFGKRFHVNGEGNGDGHQPQAVSARGRGLAAAATTGGLTAVRPGRAAAEVTSGGDESGTTTLALAYWGNPTRNKNTQAEIDAYMKANPNVKIEPQPGEFASYWEKLATQTAGGTAPDIIQMDMAYISEYGNRGALLDLSERRHVQVHRGHGRLGQDRRQAGGHQCRHQQLGHLGQPGRLREGQDGHPRRHHLDLGRDDGGRRGGRRQGERAVRRGLDLRLRRACSAPGCARTARSCSPRRVSGSRSPTPRRGST